MSGLAELLAGRVPAGVRRWVNVADVEDLAAAVRHTDKQLAHVDGWVAGDRAGVLAALGIELDFPGYYGQNLDALADCLADVDAPYVVVWDGWQVLADADRAGLDAIVDIFTERAAGRPDIWLLLRSDREIPGPGDLLD